MRKLHFKCPKCGEPGYLCFEEPSGTLGIGYIEIKTGNFRLALKAANSLQCQDCNEVLTIAKNDSEDNEQWVVKHFKDVDMSTISGFGNAEWSIMMGSVSFELKGVEAFVTIWPKELLAPKPSWWPNRVADQLQPNEPVTVGRLKALLPNFSEVKWEQSHRGMANTLEIHAVLGDLRVVVMGHAKSTQGDAMREKADALRQAAIEFQSLIS